jgi:Ca2+-binding RTX toxin-like protein/LysM repeat protein
MKTYTEFLNRLGARESGNDYQAVNKYGYLGKYQMGELSLIDTGYYINDGTKKNDWTETWTGKDGINSKEDFRNSPQAQENAIREYIDKQWSYVRHYGLDKYIGKTINGIQITESGLIAGAHLKGIRGLKTYLESDGKNDVKDKNGTPISSYISKFGGYDVGHGTSPAPQPLPGDEYTVTAGDTLSKIAKARGLTLKQLMDANPEIKNPNLIVPGQKIRIPQLNEGERGLNFNPNCNVPLNESSPVDRAKQDFDKAKDAAPPRLIDPLILDLDGDGIETRSLTDGTFFDHNSNGLAEKSGWVGEDDGLLVLDRNGNGVIDDGGELFGDQTLLSNGNGAVNGFHALSELDTNGDGNIDSADATFSELRVWQDWDGDGVSSSEELYTLNELGIQSISTASDIVNVPDGNGNTLIREGSFQFSDGRIGSIGDFNLSTDNVHTIAVEYIDVPDDIAALPDLQGFGNVYDLRQSIVRDTSGQLKGLVEQFIATTDVNVRKNIMNQIIFRWAGTEGIAINSRGTNMDARKLATLEKFFGQAFVGANGANPTSAAAIPLNESYCGLSEMFYAQLMAQTHLKDIYNKIIYTWDDETQSVKADMSTVITDIQAALAGDPDQGKALLSEFSRTIRGFGAQEMVNYLSFRETFIMQDESLGWVIDAGGLPVIDGRGQGLFPWSSHVIGTNNAEAVKGSLTEGDGFINGLVGSDVIYGTSRNETLINETGDTILVAGAGNDRIWAGTGNDILDGGAGNDELKGEGGNDTYIFRLGSGQDKIIDIDPIAGNTDTIFIGSNLTPDEISLKRIGNSLIITINNTTDTLTVHDYYKNNSPINKIEKIKFMDGTVWDEMIISSKVASTDSDDFIYGTSGDDTLHGLGGNDTVFGADGNDLLFGDTGNDTLSGDSGDDILHGLDGNDTIYGANGNDSLFGDSGNDTLYGDAGEDTLGGGEGADFLNGGAGNDTYIFNRGSGQDVISDTGVTAGNIIWGGLDEDRIFAEDYGDMFTLIADGGEAQSINEKGDVASGGAGNDFVYGSDRKDALFGGEGVDLLSGRKIIMRRAA